MVFFQKLDIRHVDVGFSFYFISYSGQYKFFIFFLLIHLPVSDIHKSFYFKDQIKRRPKFLSAGSKV